MAKPMQVVVNKHLTPSANDSCNDQVGLLNSQGSYYGNLFSCLHYNPLYPPLAGLLRQYYQLSGTWLVGSLTHWEATHNDVMITAAGQSLQIDEKESQALFLAIREFLQDYQLDALYHDSSTWLIHVNNNHPKIKSISLDSIQNRSLMPILEQIDSTLFWQRLLTELQMFLSIHTQTMQAKPVINGLWFWGEGEFDSTISKSIITDDEILLRVLSLRKEANVIELNDALSPQKGDLVLIKYPDRINFDSFKEKIKKNAVQWYWNNFTYSVPAKGWRRLWRK